VPDGPADAFKIGVPARSSFDIAWTFDLRWFRWSSAPGSSATGAGAFSGNDRQVVKVGLDRFISVPFGLRPSVLEDGLLPLPLRGAIGLVEVSVFLVRGSARDRGSGVVLGLLDVF
jgi:hypothetical protein